jgi:hypothetical protein
MAPSQLETLSGSLPHPAANAKTNNATHAAMKSFFMIAPFWRQGRRLNPMRKRSPGDPAPFPFVLLIDIFFRHVFIGVTEKFILRRTRQTLNGLVCPATADAGICTPCRVQAPRMEIVVTFHAANLPPDPTKKINECVFDFHGNLLKKSALRPTGGAFLRHLGCCRNGWGPGTGGLFPVREGQNL